MTVLLDVHQKDVIHYPEDDERFLRYEGETKNGKPWGNGTMYYVSGGSYVGQWADGLRHGHGLQKYGQASGGDHYEGSWKNDTKSGFGIYVWKDGARYEGEFVNGLRHGYGLYKFSKYDKQKRDFYQGEWNEGLKSGLGKTYWKDGSFYVGQVSISSTFYKQLFHMTVLFEAFLYSQFVLVFFWQKYTMRPDNESQLRSDNKYGVSLFGHTHYWANVSARSRDPSVWAKSWS